MRSSLRSLLFVVALLFSQHAAVLHGLAHAEHEIALAGDLKGKAPALDHGADVCAVFGALGHALGNAGAAPLCADHIDRTLLAAFDAVPAFARFVFDSRAPPLSA